MRAEREERGEREKRRATSGRKSAQCVCAVCVRACVVCVCVCVCVCRLRGVCAAEAAVCGDGGQTDTGKRRGGEQQSEESAFSLSLVRFLSLFFLSPYPLTLSILSSPLLSHTHTYPPIHLLRLRSHVSHMIALCCFLPSVACSAEARSFPCFLSLSLLSLSLSLSLSLPFALLSLCAARGEAAPHRAFPPWTTVRPFFKKAASKHRAPSPVNRSERTGKKRKGGLCPLRCCRVRRVPVFSLPRVMAFSRPFSWA